MRTWAAGSLCLILALACVAVRAPAGRVAEPAAWRPAVWHWAGPATVPPADAAEWRGLGATDLLCWRGTVVPGGDGPRFERRGGRPAGLDLAQRWSVVRIEAAAARQLGTAGADALLAPALQGLASGDAGLQVDWDVPSARLGAYAEWLRRLRHRLPPGTGLSCTGLVAWLGDGGDGLREVVGAVDWWAPQAYATGLPPDPSRASRLIATVDLPAVVRRCTALGAPYRVGLATYEQVSLWDGDGALLAATIPVRVEDLLAAGLGAPEVRASSPERILAWRVAARTAVGPMALPAGSRVFAAMPTAAGLATDLALLRAAGAPCLGPAFFRLATADGLPCLGAGQVRLAASGGPVPEPALRARLAADGSGWSLAVENGGSEECCDFAHPWSVVVTGAAVPRQLPAGVAARPVLGVAACAPGRADGVRFDVSFLRAGATLTLRGDARPGRTCRLLDAIPPQEP